MWEKKKKKKKKSRKILYNSGSWLPMEREYNDFLSPASSSNFFVSIIGTDEHTRPHFESFETYYLPFKKTQASQSKEGRGINRILFYFSNNSI